MSEVFKHLGMGEFPSAHEYNRLVDAVSGLLKASDVNYFVDSRGLHARRMPGSGGGDRILMMHVGGEVIPHDSGTLIPVNTIISDPRGWYDPGNNGFVAPLKGIYCISSSFWVTYGNQVDVSAYAYARNAAGGSIRSTKAYTPSVGYGGAGVYWATFGMMECDAGDLIQFFFHHKAGAGNTMTVTSGGHAGMWLIR